MPADHRSADLESSPPGLCSADIPVCRIADIPVGKSVEFAARSGLFRARQVENLRYGAAQRSRNQYGRVNKTQRRDARRGDQPSKNLCVHRVSAVKNALRKFAQAATISRDTDRQEFLRYGPRLRRLL
jgi:hypothetical protein